MLPQHIDNIPNNREAYAPYNFVPLPETVVPAEDLPAQDTYHAGRHTGRIVCTVTTSSPLYVRSAMTSADFAQYGRSAFNTLPACAQDRRAAFFHRGDAQRPVIPGSSLRGMLRNLVEIAAYGKIERVMDRQLFYRSVSDQNYLQEFVGGAGGVYQARIRTGFLRLQNGSATIEECDYGRIERPGVPPSPRGLANIPTIPRQPLMTGNGPNAKPNWAYQHQTIYVTVDPPANHLFPANGRHPNVGLRFRAITRASYTPFPGAETGTLVITGGIPNKHMEFVFLNTPVLHTYTIDDEMLQRFEADDQLTQWQEGAFPPNQPAPRARRKAGGLRDGEPVFFLLNPNGTVRFFGRAQLFRLPFGIAPYELVPPTHRSPQVIDIAEAIFGMVRGDRQSAGAQTIAGRVSVSDAVCITEGEDLWLSAGRITPRVLAAPKPTTYQHYLVQTAYQRTQLRRYNSPAGTTTIRGHKLYWHKGNATATDIEADPAAVERAPTQYTGIRPVRAGVSFRCEVRFENLSDVELGALLWVLQLGEDSKYRLKLGMGKSLGLGAIAVQSEVHLVDTAQRYATMFAAEEQLATGERVLTDVERRAKAGAFDVYVRTHSGAQAASLSATPRIMSLLALLSWPGPHPEATRSMEIERPLNAGARPGPIRDGKVNEFADRLVLPLPQEVLAQHPPPAPPQPPTVAPALPDIETAMKKETHLIGKLQKPKKVKVNGTDIPISEVALEPDQLIEPADKKVVYLTRNHGTGGFRCAIIEIDKDTEPGTWVVWLERRKRPEAE